MSAEAKKPEVVEYKELIADLARRSKLPEAKARIFMKNFAGEISAQLKSGKIVRITGFGAFKMREVVSKGSGDDKATKRVVFAAAKKLKEAVEFKNP